MNSLIKIIEDHDGHVNDPKWHAVVFTDTVRTACGVAVDSAGECVEVLTKDVVRGGITCRYCLGTIEEYKAIKL
jgi:hypothetical protein